MSSNAWASQFHDYYIKSSDKELINSVLFGFTTKVGPVGCTPYSPATEHSMEQLQVGEEGKYYGLIRLMYEIDFTAIDGVELCDEETGVKLLGVWE